MREYAPFKAHLERRDGRPELLTFEDIEAILGVRSRASAVRHRSFRANDNEGYHPHVRAWSDREDHVVRFERTR